MTTLHELRKQFDRLDDELIPLLVRRMELSRQVAQVKAAGGGRVYDPDREQEILKRVRAAAGSGHADAVCTLYAAVLRQSRKGQYLALAEAGTEPELTKDVLYEDPLVQNGLRVCYQGIEGAWSHIAARTMTGSDLLSAAPTFSAVLEEIRADRADIGILPLENSTAGVVSGVTDCVEQYGYYFVAGYMQKIDQCLASVPGAREEDVRTVYSHPQALLQCSAYIAAKDLTEISCSNTAVAARRVAGEGIAAQAVICSRQAAELYGLTVVSDRVGNNQNNTTRFVAVSPRFCAPAEGGRISLTFTLPHQSGSLVSALSAFSDHGLNLTAIHSRPLPDKPWQYRFYADFNGSLCDTAVRALLLQLENELPSISILGCYREK